MVLVYRKMKYNENMMFFCFFLAVLLFLVAAIQPQKSEVSAFELIRQQKAGSVDNLDQLRQRYFGHITMLQRIVTSLLLVILVLCLVAAFEWPTAIVISLLAAFFCHRMADTSLSFLQALIYRPLEPHVLRLFQKTSPWLGRVVGSTETDAKKQVFDGASSKEELVAYVHKSSQVMSSFETQLVKAALKFEGKTVGDAMMHREDVIVVDRDEVLGPITLDNLHKTGRSFFPVVGGGLDETVGVLNLRDFLIIDGNQNSPKAHQAMDEDVEYIPESASLSEVLRLFRQTHKPLFIVRGQSGAAVGILEFDSVVELLAGPLAD